jgi:hypothetical protein
MQILKTRTKRKLLLLLLVHLPLLKCAVRTRGAVKRQHSTPGVSTSYFHNEVMMCQWKRSYHWARIDGSSINLPEPLRCVHFSDVQTNIGELVSDQ